MHVEAPNVTINLLDALPALGKALDAEALELARRHAVVAAVDLEPGSWAPSAHAEARPGDLGLLVVDVLVDTRGPLLPARVGSQGAPRSGDPIRHVVGRLPEARDTKRAADASSAG